MAYMNQEKKAIIATRVKPVLAKYGMKGTISVQHHSTLVVTLASGPIDFEDTREINQYWLADVPGIRGEFSRELVAAIKGTEWFEKSDVTTDYFHTAYYITIRVGRYDKPYQIKGAA